MISSKIGFGFMLLIMLMIISSAEESSFQDYLQQLDDQKAKVRMTAAWSLGTTGDSRAIGPLIEHLEDKDEDVRQWTVLALANLGQPAIEPLIEALTEGSSTVRWQAAAALGLIGDPRAAHPLIRALEDGNLETRYWSAIALGQVNNSSSRGPLIQALGDSDPAIREAAGWSLLKVDAGAADLLITLLKDDNSSRRMGAAAALGRINDSRAVQPLISALKDPDENVRSNAAASLGQYNEINSIEHLIKSLSDDSRDVREKAKSSVARIGQPAVGALILALGEGDYLGRAEAAEALGEIGDQRAIAPMIEAFKTGESQLRHNAVLALIKLNKTSGRETFLDFLQANSSDVRADAAWALGLSGDDRAKTPLMQLMANDENSNVRLNASKALRDLGRKWEPVILES